MHVVLGQPEDPTCRALAAQLNALGFASRIVSVPFSEPFHLSISPAGRCTTRRSESSLGPHLAGQVDSVFVRLGAALDPSGWEAGDLAYMQAETHAALLAWITSLDCPVVNRVSADLWYRPGSHLLHWLPALHGFGLHIPEVIISSRILAAKRFRRDLEAQGVGGAICVELANSREWIVGPDDWAGIASLQGYAPVCLVEPHGAPMSLCVVGSEVIQNDPSFVLDEAFKDLLKAFSVRVALDFVEITVAHVRSGIAVVDVEPFPRLEHFNRNAQAEILNALCGLLTGQRLRGDAFAQVVP